MRGRSGPPPLLAVARAEGMNEDKISMDTTDEGEVCGGLCSISAMRRQTLCMGCDQDRSLFFLQDSSCQMCAVVCVSNNDSTVVKNQRSVQRSSTLR